MAERNEENVTFSIFKGYGGGVNMGGVTSLKPDAQIHRESTSKLEGKEEVKVNVRTLDSLLENELKHIEKIDIVSMDIEGGELDALKGFDLKKWKPTILLIENHGNRKEISDLIINSGYELDKFFTGSNNQVRDQIYRRMVS